MHKFLAVLSCVVVAALTRAEAAQYVFDILKPALNAAEVQDLLASRGVQWPTLTAVPDNSNFDCSSKKQPGFYADPSTQCQVFHRCDQNGNMTSFICVNTTVFNQITLVCDYWYNVDCKGFTAYEDFANSRLYQDGAQLFDTPPADYVSPDQVRQQQQQQAQLQREGGQQQGSRPQVVASKNKASVAKATTKKAAVAVTVKPKAGRASAGGSASINVASGRSDDQEQNGTAESNAQASNVDQGQDTTTAAAEDTTAAAEDTTTVAAEETTTAAQ